MTKKAPAKTKKSPGVKAFVKRHKKHIIIGLVALVVLVFGIYRLQIYREQRQFAQAEVVLADLSAKIQKELGPPISSSTDKSCGYASVVYGRGRRGCSVGFDLTYPTVSVEILKQKQAKILEIVNSNKTVTRVSSNIDNFEETWQISKYKETDISFTLKGSQLRCTESATIEADKPTLSVGIGCDRDAITEHFPLRKY